MNKSVLAWHFCGPTLRDGRKTPRKGVWLKHDGPVKMCASGLHASRRLIDALGHAPGNTLPDYAPRIERSLHRRALLRDGLQALCALVVFILALSLVR